MERGYIYTDSHQSSFEDAPGVFSPALWDGLLWAAKWALTAKKLGTDSWCAWKWMGQGDMGGTPITSATRHCGCI